MCSLILYIYIHACMAGWLAVCLCLSLYVSVCLFVCLFVRVCVSVCVRNQLYNTYIIVDRMDVWMGE